MCGMSIDYIDDALPRRRVGWGGVVAIATVLDDSIGHVSRLGVDSVIVGR